MCKFKCNCNCSLKNRRRYYHIAPHSTTELTTPEIPTDHACKPSYIMCHFWTSSWKRSLVSWDVPLPELAVDLWRWVVPKRFFLLSLGNQLSTYAASTSQKSESLNYIVAEALNLTFIVSDCDASSLTLREWVKFGTAHVRTFWC